MTDYGSTEILEKALSLSDVLSESIVTVEIGPDHKKYYVHKALLVHHSEYFKGALRGAWKEARESLVILEDVRPVVFNIFVHWLYTQQVPISKECKEWNQVMGTEGTSFLEDALTRVQAYSFGDRFLAPSFRRAMNKSFVDTMEEVVLHPPTMHTLVNWAFENVPSDRPLLQLLADKFCLEWEEWTCNEAEAAAFSLLHWNFIARVLRRPSFLRDFPDYTKNLKIEDCCYLEHTDEPDDRDSCDKRHMEYMATRNCSYF